jgi:DNA-binding NtrC family response regulator
VRELRHVLQRSCAFAEAAPLTAEDLFGWRTAQTPDPGSAQSLSDYLARCERDYVARCLAEHDGRIAATAAALGVTRKGLWQKLRRLGLVKEQLGAPDR